MEGEDLILQNGNGETALCVAAVAGNVKMAKTMVKKNEAILTIPDSQGKLPLCKAALYGNQEMVRHLYNSSQNMTGCFWTPANRDYVLVKCIEADLYGIALRIVEDCPELATNRDALGVLARKPDAFGREHCSSIYLENQTPK